MIINIQLYSKTTLQKRTWTTPYFSVKILCSDRGNTKWYHHGLDEHKDRIFIEKYGAVQVCFGEVVCCVIF